MKKTMIIILLMVVAFSFGVFSIDWTNFNVFDGGSPPYAANWPGCR